MFLNLSLIFLIIFSEFLQTFANKAHEYNFSISIVAADNVNELQVYERKINFNCIDGIVVINPKINDSRIQYLKKKNIPFVFLGQVLGNEDIFWVGLDDFKGAKETTEYLFEHGYQQIACISGD